MEKEKIDAIVVGTGLAGLTTTLRLLQQDVSVTLLEKTDHFGGNSIKASSGINGVPTKYQPKYEHDSVEAFIDDTQGSGKGLSNIGLVKILAANSKAAIDWLTNEENNIDLSVVTQLGGHSFARTHRGGGKLPPGFAIVSALTRRLNKYANEPSSRLTILKNATLSNILLSDSQTVKGVTYISGDTKQTIYGKNLVLATGGYSADFTSTQSLLHKYRPDLISFPSTNGKQTTGDGQKIAERDANANLIHMDQVQIHPTGFIKLSDDSSPNDKWKFLCGELIRGIGGILISPNTGKRFINELTTRDDVTKGIIENCKISPNNEFGIDDEKSISIIVVNSEDYLKAKNHIDFYVSQNLMFKGEIADIVDIAKKLNPSSNVEESTINQGVQEYNSHLISHNDVYGRSKFGSQFGLESPIYFGLVTPVLHFSMGGIEINEFGQVINNDKQIINNLYAVGEVSGGLHGGNRLAGSSLLECVVFGTVVSDSIKNKLGSY